MGDRSKIEWTDATWNPVTGCSKITGSPGCEHCYAATFTERWRGTPGHYFTDGFDVTERRDKLELPLSWKRPRRVFVNSLSDLGHRDVSLSLLVEVFAVMATAARHTFLVLTKRPGRVRSLLRQADVDDPDSFAGQVAIRAADRGYAGRLVWPLPNVWLGTSAENQAWAAVRVPVLLSTPAAVRFVSAEPLLGPLDLSEWLGSAPGQVQWVIAGGESGHGARPMHPSWPRGLRDQCTASGAAYFFKQWGAWRLVAEDGAEPAPLAAAAGLPDRPCHPVSAEPSVGPGARPRGAGIASMMRVRASVAGRELDGRHWDEYPPVVPSTRTAPPSPTRRRRPRASRKASDA